MWPAGWKGENVSTNEVAEAISGFPGIQEANVYGVEIPGKVGAPGRRRVFSTVHCAHAACVHDDRAAGTRTGARAWRPS